MDGTYEFPMHRLQPLTDPKKTPLIFFACGSFSPVTFLHLRMFEMARDDVKLNTSEFEVVGGYLSFVNDAYKKPGLAPAEHRFNMCKLACDKTSDWLMVDPWEARQDQYTPTARVLDHLDYQVNELLHGVEVVGGQAGERRKVRVVFLAGSDLIQTMSQPGVWADEDLHHILGKFGLYIIERAESEIDQSLFSTSSVHSRSPLALYRDRIRLVPQLVRNDVSSTKVRMFVRKQMSIEYLIPGVVVKYIKQHGLYQSSIDGSNGGVVPPVDQHILEQLLNTPNE